MVAILGATGSGKADLAAAAARACGALLLVCDSMKVYRGMDLGTAKPLGPVPVPGNISLPGIFSIANQ